MASKWAHSNPWKVYWNCPAPVFVHLKVVWSGMVKVSLMSFDFGHLAHAGKLKSYLRDIIIVIEYLLVGQF